MRVALIAAVADNGVIGRDGDLPWRLPADLKRFRRLTVGHHLIVGRRTWESIGRPLAGRRMVVLTRGAPVEAPGVASRAGLDEALALASEGGDDEPFIAGGAEIYRQALPRADRLYLTRVRARPDGDVRFPDLDLSGWRLVERREREADARNPWPLTFEIYDREPPRAGPSTSRSSSRLT